MIRAVGWLCIVVLAVGAHWYDSDILRGACAAGVLALLAITAPPSLRISLGVVAVVAIAIVLIFGSSAFFDVLPALIAAFVAYLFGRTLLPGHRPLIARAIISVDGPRWLDDPGGGRLCAAAYLDLDELFKPCSRSPRMCAALHQLEPFPRSGRDP